MTRECEGKVAIVTGASRGIGRAIALRLARAGARVAITARTLDPVQQYEGSLSETAESIAALGGEVHVIQADLATEADRERLVEEAASHLGPPHILINNAAVTYLQPAVTLTDKRIRLMFEVQVHAPLSLSRLVLPHMKSRGAGWIVNISSKSAIHPVGPPFETLHADGGYTVYGMVKSALERMSTGLAAEFSAWGVAVNALAPWDIVATEGTAAHNLIDGWTLEPVETMAEAALLLAASDPKVVTGRVAYSQPLLAEFKRAIVSPASRG